MFYGIDSKILSICIKGSAELFSIYKPDSMLSSSAFKYELSRGTVQQLTHHSNGTFVFVFMRSIDTKLSSVRYCVKMTICVIGHNRFCAMGIMRLSIRQIITVHCVEKRHVLCSPPFFPQPKKKSMFKIGGHQDSRLGQEG